MEGEWSGYTSQQQRVVHREVTLFPAEVAHLRGITYGDGTSLLLSLRECEPRERVVAIRGYCSLVRAAARLNKSWVHVAELRT